jgi:hypothetical protein
MGLKYSHVRYYYFSPLTSRCVYDINKQNAYHSHHNSLYWTIKSICLMNKIGNMFRPKLGHLQALNYNIF